MKHPMTSVDLQHCAISTNFRPQDWMWEPDTITGLWQSREVFNANWLRDYSIQCGAMQSTVYSTPAAIPNSPSTQGIAYIWIRQMRLLCLCVNEWNILRYGQRFDWTRRHHEKQRNEELRFLIMHSLPHLWHLVSNVFFSVVGEAKNICTINCK